MASGIGAVIAYKACIAGASGGCQAEIGTASAMAAGALVALRDGTGQQIGHAVAMALKNLRAWCVIRWPAWWRFPVSSAMSSAR